MILQKNAQFIEESCISSQDRAFQYGDGCFSTAKYQHGEISLWHRHQQRFSIAQQKLYLNLELKRLENEKNIFLSHLKQQGLKQGIIKILVSRGVGQRGYTLPSHPVDIYFYFFPHHYHNHSDQIPTIPITISLPQSIYDVMPELRGIKSLNRLEQIILKQRLQQHHADEALCFDQNNHLVEAISSNCFVYYQQRWHTPTLATSGIHGIMRAEILSRMQQYKIDCHIADLHFEQCQTAEAIFLCNALHPMQIVQSLDQRHLNPQPCQQLFHQLRLIDL